MPLEHSRYFSASASHRWISCPPSVVGAQLEQHNTDAADEGTMGHHFSELTLKDRLIAMRCGADPLQYHVGRYKGKIHQGWKLATQHISYLQGYVDFVWSLVAAGGRLYVENRVRYDEPLGVDGMAEIFAAFGTADALIVMPDGTLFVVDLKFGKWVVDAERNSQQALYAIGGYRSLRLLHNIKKFVFVIYQPRTAGRPDDQWRTTFDWLEKFTDTAHHAAQIIVDLVDMAARGEPIPAKFFNPTKENCEFCKKEGCSARKKSWGR